MFDGFWEGFGARGLRVDPNLMPIRLLEEPNDLIMRLDPKDPGHDKSVARWD